MAEIDTSIPVKFRGIFQKARTSKATAVKAMCLQCVGFVMRDVAECVDRACPLHPHRPYQHLLARRGGGQSETEEA